MTAIDPNAAPIWEIFLRFAVALAIGLLIGIERGWERREAAPGGRIAGIRTFGLIALFGAAAGYWPGEGRLWVVASGLIGLGILTSSALWQKAKQTDDIGITTLVAALFTFILGALASAGALSAAAGLAVVTALLLGTKQELHAFVERIRRDELLATLRLLLISVVALPLLPDRGFGPWDAFNPFQIWLLVVVLAAISYVGYMAIRLVGTRRGILATGLFGGLASSTAVAVNLGRLGRGKPELHPMLASGILAAAAMMFPRLLVVTAIVAPALSIALLWPMLAAAAAAFIVAGALARRSSGHLTQEDDDAAMPRNPLDLRTALQFGAILAAVMILVRAFEAWFGDTGLYTLAAISGLADVDAITVSIATMLDKGETAERTAAAAVVIAAAVNTMVKPALVAIGGDRRLASRVALPLAAALAAGGAALWLPALR